MKKSSQASYIQFDSAASLAEHDTLIQGGISCHVQQLKDLFAWMPGTVNLFTGWSNDGKGTMLDFLEILGAMKNSFKICQFRQEDMDSVKIDGEVKIKANRIYKNIAWSYTGKTWNKSFAEKYHCPKMSIDEEMEAMAWVTKRFFVVYPKDRRYKNVRDNFLFMWEVYGATVFRFDPWNTVKVESDWGDDKLERLINVFIDLKETALEKDSIMNIVNHPITSSGFDMKDGKGKEAPYKVVTQNMQIGGSAWDMKMDGAYSIYRQNRHKDLKDPAVTFFNLKQRAAEIVGVERGHYGKIVLNRQQRRYFFDGICPIDGSMTAAKRKELETQPPLFADTPQPAFVGGTDGLPF